MLLNPAANPALLISKSIEFHSEDKLAMYFSGLTTPTLSPSLPISLTSGHIIFSFTLGPVSREGGALCGLRTIDFFLI